MNKSDLNPAYEETYYIVPRYIRKLVGKHLIFLDVYETIYQFWNKGKTCFLSNKAICSRTGASERQVKEALTFFEKNGELRRENRGLKRYLIKPEILIETDEGAPPPSCIDINQEGAPPPRGGRSTALGGGAPPPTEYKEVEYKEVNIILNTNSVDKKASDLKISAGGDLTPTVKKELKPIEYLDTYYLTPEKLDFSPPTSTAFEAFWNLYPRKSNKPRCFALWQQGNCDSKIELILTKLKVQIETDAHWKDNYIPTICNYVMGERWNDDINPPAKGGNKILNHKDKSWASKFNRKFT